MSPRPEPSPAAPRARDALLDARTQLLSALQRACHPLHRAHLEDAIAALDSQLAECDRQRPLSPDSRA